MAVNEGVINEGVISQEWLAISYTVVWIALVAISNNITTVSNEGSVRLGSNMRCGGCGIAE